MSITKSKARKLAEFLRNITEEAKLTTEAVQNDKVVTTGTALDDRATDATALVSAASVTSYVGDKLDDYVHNTHDINLTFTGDVTGHGTITDMGHTSFNLTLDAETLPVQTGYVGKFLTTDGTTASWATVDTSKGDTAYSWGDHSQEGYLTSETNDYVDSISFSSGVLSLGRTGSLPNLTVNLDGRYLQSYVNTTYNVSAVDVSGGKAVRLTGSDGSTDDVKFAAGSNVSLARSGDTITISSTDTNSETTTNLVDNGDNTITYTNEEGTAQTIDLSLYLDDTNLARILSGTMNNSGIATFTRDDDTTFTVDMSVLLDDTNLSRITSASWNTSNGVLTLTRNDATTVAVDLDNRYLTGYTETDTLDSVTSRGAVSTKDITISAPDLGGAPATTALLKIHGYEGRGAGIKIKDSVNSAAGASQREWFIGSGYNQSGFNIGYSPTGSQSSYSAQSKLRIDTNGNTTIAGTVTASSFSGALNYNDITNPPVIENSVDYINGASFNTSTGVLSLTGVGRAGASVDLDGRYYNTTDSDNRYVNVTGDTMTGLLVAEDGIRIGTGNHNTDGRASLTFGEGTTTVDSMYIEYDGENLSGDANAIIIGSNKDGVGDVFRVTYGGSVKVGSSLVFHDNYHPNADKWTTARTNTVTITGDATGSGNASVDGTGNWTVTVPISVNDNSHDHNSLDIVDTRNSGVRLPNDYADHKLTAEFTDDINGAWWSALTMKGWHDGYSPWQLIGNANTNFTETLYVRFGNGPTNTWGSLRSLWHSGNFNPSDYLLTANYVDTDNYVDSVSFNTANGILTLGRTGSLPDLTIDLDGRYITSETDNQTLSWNGSNGQLSISGGNTVDLDNRYAYASHSHSNYMPIRWNTPYTVPTATTWGSFNLGNGTMMQAGGTGRPPGSTHGYWFVGGKRDTAGGYAGLYFDDYNGGNGLFVGGNTVGTSAPNWDRVWTANTDGSGSGLDADLLDGLHASAFAPASHSHNYVSEGGTSFSGEYPVVVRVSANNIYSDGNIRFQGSDSKLTVDGIVNTPIYQVNGTTVIDSSRNTSFANLAYSGSLVNGSIKQEWTTNYVLNNATPKELLYSNGQSLPNGGVYRFSAHISGTGTDNWATAVYWNQNGTWKLNVTQQSGASSNHPEFVIISNVPTLIIDHPNNYTVHVFAERLEINEGSGTDNSAGFGADSFMGSVGQTLRYNPNGGASNYNYGWNVFHDAYHPNADKWTTARTITLGGDLTGSVSLDGSANVTLSAQVVSDSHNHNHSDGNFTVNGNLTVTGSTTLGNGNGDKTKINDILELYSTDSGDSHFYFGENSSGGYGSYWYWDSNYTHTWYSRHAGTNTAIMYHDTRDTSYLNMSRALNMRNKNIDYVNQLHFNANVRFYDEGNDSYLNYKWGDTGAGGIRFLDGNTSVQGTIYGEGNGNFGLLDNDGSWAVRIQTGTNPLELRCNNNVEFRVYDSYTLSLGSSRAPIFYDSDNTSYYLDPASSGTSLKVRGKIILEQGNTTAGGIELNSVKDATWPFEFTTNDVGNDNQSGFWVGSNGYPDMRLRRDSGTIRALISSWEESYVSNGFRVEGTTDLNGPLYVGSGTSSNIYMTDTDHGQRRIHCNSNRIGFLNEANGWGSYCGDGGDWYSDQSIRTPIFYDSDNTGYYWNPNTSSAHRLQTPSGYLDIGPKNSSFCHFATDRSEFYFDRTVRFDGAGARAYDAYASANFPVYYDYNDTATYINPNATSHIKGRVDIQENVSAPGYTFMSFRSVTTNNQLGSIYRSYGTMTYGTSSDYRLKENVVDLTSATDRVKLLKPKRFNFIEFPEVTVDGFIAHEAQEVVPEAVVGEKDEVDHHGNEKHQSMDHSKLVPLLTAALQEALQEIDNLKARLDVLESQ
jgi:hypothetical protein